MVPNVACSEMLSVANSMNDIFYALHSPDLSASAAGGMPVHQGSPTPASAMQTAHQALATSCVSMEDTETIALRIFVTLKWLHADHEGGIKLFQQMQLYSILFTLLAKMLLSHLHDVAQNVTALFDAGLELLLRLWKCFGNQFPLLPMLCRAFLWRLCDDVLTSSEPDARCGSQPGLAGIMAIWALLGNALPHAL